MGLHRAVNTSFLQTHFLLYGEGFQTWEYSPVYAIRSYGYLLLHAIPVLITNTSSKVLTRPLGFWGWCL